MPFRASEDVTKIETADFELPDYNHDEVLWSNFVFGITPPEGIVLPVIRSFGVGNSVHVVKALAQRFSGSGNRSIQFNGRDKILEMELTNYAMCAGIMGDDKLEEMVAKRMEAWHMESEEHLQGNPYCLMISDAQRDTYDTDLSVPNMKGLVIGQVESFLVHNLMRLFKQADVTVGVPVLLFDNFYQNTESFSDKIKIISNGKEGIVLKA